ncbi:hypothetical protein GCM10027081_16520 [Cupriavidus yeoncheonensis]
MERMIGVPPRTVKHFAPGAGQGNNLRLYPRPNHAGTSYGRELDWAPEIDRTGIWNEEERTP